MPNLTKRKKKTPATGKTVSDDVASSHTITSWEDLKTQLTQMKRASKRADFDSDLVCKWQALNAFLNSLTDKQRHQYESEPEYWKARTLIHELNDVFKHDADINDQVYKDGPRIYEELKRLEDSWSSNSQRSGQNQSLLFRTLTREKVLFCSRYGIELKRREATREASRLFIRLLGFTKHELKTKDVPCFGTRAALSYGLATICRQQEDFKLAREYYAEAIYLYSERAKRRGAQDPDDVLFTTRRIAMCIGLGFGWISLTRGRLRRAENAFTTARAMLAQTPHWVVVDYIEYLYGALKRCRAGSNEERLNDAIDSLITAREAFQERHVLYETRVARELALAYNLLGDFEKAWPLAQLIEERALKEKGIRAKVDAYVLKSRILRQQRKYKEALKEAETALELTKGSQELLPKVDALIASGECLLGVAHSTKQREARYDQARSVFEAANKVLIVKDENGKRKVRNPKITAVCELRLAQCYARVKDRRRAEEHFSKYRRLQKKVEHEWVRELGDEVREEIDNSTPDFFISAEDAARFDSGAMMGDLQRWMVEQALEETKKNVKEAAALLGIERPTVYRWLNNPTPRRARIPKR
jgi:tetratricopeptide (TPR) repeat protein